jgi:hypothetical protein
LEKHDEVIASLKRIEENQVKALLAQEQQIGFARAQLERSEKSLSESLALQRLAAVRQTQIRNVGLPLIIVLLALLGYLLIKWRML